MKYRICVALLLTLAACSKPAKPAVQDLAANRIGNDDVTDVPDESADDNTSSDNSTDPD